MSEEYKIGEIVDGYEIVDESYFFDKNGKIRKGVLDEAYIDMYLEYPNYKPSQILKMVADEVGIDYKVTKDKAYQFHKRLRPKVEARLAELNTADKVLGRSVLRKLATEAESESVRASTATTLSKGLYPDVQVKKEMSLEDINRELEKLEKEQEQLGIH